MGSSCVVRFNGLNVAVWRLGLLAVFLAATRVNAADRAWRNPAGGTFSSASNWFGGVPGASDTAGFGLSTPGLLGALPHYTVSFTADATNQALRVFDDRVTFDLNGHIYTTTDANLPMQLGMVSGASGQLGVLDGIVILPFQSEMQIATTSGGSGLLAVAAGGLVIGSPELIVGLNGNGTLNIFDNGDLIAAAVTIGENPGSIGTANVEGGGSALISSLLRVGYFGTGTLSVTAGGRVESASAVIASASTGTASIDGVGSRWQCSGDLEIGYTASVTGTMNITTGGLVQNANGLIGNFSSGTVHVDGVNSQWINSGGLTVGKESPSIGLLDVANGGLVRATALQIGERGTGTLSILSGGRVESTSSSIASAIGGSAGGGTGTATIDGPKSTWLNSSSLIVGYRGSGTTTITAGGLVQNTFGFVGLEGDGTVHVDGFNSQWINSNDLSVGVNPTFTGLLEVANGGRVQAGPLTIGASGNGTLDISSGGRVDSQTSTIGSSSGSTGMVTVAGAGSKWTIDGALRVGNDAINNRGVGTVRIQAGGTVAVAGETTLHQGDSVVLEGGTLNTREIDFLQGLGTFQWTSGTFNVQDYPRTLQVPAGGVLDAGFGFGAATTTVHGGYNQSAGAVLEIEGFGFGSTATGMDHLTVTDTAVVGGALNLKLNSGTVINPALNYEIMSALSIAGSFANVANGQRLTTVDGLGSFVVNYGAGSTFDPTQIVLSSFESVGIPGDYNGDGVVDAADYVVWRDNLNSTATLPGDTTPGMVTAADYQVWRANFGQTAGSGSSASANAAVPEPATLVLLMLVVAGWCLRRVRAE